MIINKRKGVSLIVLIITIVVIIIIATAIIVSIGRANIIKNANQATFKQDIGVFKDELALYIANEYSDKLGKYDSTLLDADKVGIYYNDELQSGTVLDIISISGTKYEDMLYVEDGKLVLNSKKSTGDEIRWASQIGIKSNKKELVLNKPDNDSVGIEVDPTYKDKVSNYKYEIYEVDESGNKTLVESKENVTEPNVTFNNLTQCKTYEIVATVNYKDGTKEEFKSTVYIELNAGTIEIKTEPNVEQGWTKENVKVTLEYSGKLPYGYRMEYKKEGENWTEYTTTFEIDKNMEVQARLYNETTGEEIALNKKEITYIEKEHVYSAWQTTKAATTTSDGLKKRTCTICGKEETMVIPKTTAISNWNYTLDTTNKKVKLINYKGSETNVTVYSDYEINGTMYKTTLESNYWDYSADNFKLTNYMFMNNTTVKNVVFNEGIDTSNLRGIAGLVYNATALTNIDISKLDTSNVTDMVATFGGCTSLKTIDVNKLNTSSVTNMHYMFGGSAFTSLNISNLNTSKVTNMQYMFNSCPSLTTVDLGSIDTSNVTNMFGMFAGCNQLKNIDFSMLDTSKVTNLANMFWSCSSLASANFTDFETQNVTTMTHMFWGCDSLQSLDLTSFDTSNVTDMESMFCDCDNLKQIKFSSKFNTAKVTKMTRMFCLCKSLTELDLTSFDTRNTTLMNYLFEYCGNLKTIYVTSGKWSTSQANTHKIFSGCGTSTVTYK